MNDVDLQSPYIYGEYGLTINNSDTTLNTVNIHDVEVSLSRIVAAAIWGGMYIVRFKIILIHPLSD
jgi:hypothetical protein